MLLHLPTSTVLEIAWPQQISPPGNPHLSLRARYRYISNVTATCACCTPSWRSACFRFPLATALAATIRGIQHQTLSLSHTSAKNKMHFVLKSMKMRRKPWEGLRGCTRIHACLCTYTCTCRILHTNVYGVLLSSTQEEGVGMKKTRRKKGPEDQEDEQNHKDKENQQDQESKYI